MDAQVHKYIQISLPAEGVKAVLHIRGLEALDLWMEN